MYCVEEEIEYFGVSLKYTPVPSILTLAAHLTRVDVELSNAIRGGSSLLPTSTDPLELIQ
jgi:hypothetical protein